MSEIVANFAITQESRMLKNIDPVSTNAWEKLWQHHADLKGKHLRTLFAEDPNRFSNFSARFEDILVDYSKNLLDEDTLQSLLQLAEETELKDAIEKMFSGDK